MSELKLNKKSDFEYVLHDWLGREKGIITVNDYHKDYIQIVRFWVHHKYRSSEKRVSKGKYGTQLMNAVIQEAQRYSRISRIIVVPKPEELTPGIKEMEREVLYKIYERLGFCFVNETDITSFERKMELKL